MSDHQWIAMVTIPLDSEQTEQLYKTGVLDEDYYKKSQSVDVGCFRCEKELHSAWGKPCKEASND